MEKKNPWVWTALAESKIPDRKAGEIVSTAFLMEGYDEWYPYTAWIRKGYVERKDQQ